MISAEQYKVTTHFLQHKLFILSSIRIHCQKKKSEERLVEWMNKLVTVVRDQRLFSIKFYSYSYTEQWKRLNGHCFICWYDSPYLLSLLLFNSGAVQYPQHFQLYSPPLFYSLVSILFLVKFILPKVSLFQQYFYTVSVVTFRRLCLPYFCLVGN